MSRENKYKVTKVSKIGNTKMYPKEFDVINYISHKKDNIYQGDMFQKMLDNQMDKLDANTFQDRVRAELKEKELANMLDEEMKNMGINRRKL